MTARQLANAELCAQCVGEGCNNCDGQGYTRLPFQPDDFSPKPPLNVLGAPPDSEGPKHQHECFHDRPTHLVCHCECGAWKSAGTSDWQAVDSAPTRRGATTESSARRTLVTDLEKFVALYESVGIVLVAAHKPPLPPGWGSTQNAADLQSLLLQEGTHPRIIGYSGFGTEIVFDAAGKFLRQEIWE